VGPFEREHARCAQILDHRRDPHARVVRELRLKAADVIRLLAEVELGLEVALEVPHEAREESVFLKAASLA
jgi:hypothetical protein